MFKNELIFNKLSQTYVKQSGDGKLQSGRLRGPFEKRPGLLEDGVSGALMGHEPIRVSAGGDDSDEGQDEISNVEDDKVRLHVFEMA